MERDELLTPFGHDHGGGIEERMEMDENEKFYDETIAPALLTLARQCHERGMSFLAAVEYEPGSVGRTSHYVEGFGHAMWNALAAIQAGDNVDVLIGHLVGRAKQFGHGSAFLYQLGVPMQPSTSAKELTP